jgi:SAM-dependent methyltransferase
VTFVDHADTRCRGCGAADLCLLLSLGATPLANALLPATALSHPEPIYPLDLKFCRSCALVQISHSASPEQLFGNYLYLSSFSDTMLRSAEEISNRLADSRRLGAESLIIELASNDGYLLQNYKRRGIPVLGVEPARNVAEIALQEKGIPSIPEFFGESLAQRLAQQGRLADVIHANNVLAHVPDPNDFVAGIGILLKRDGIASIEVPHVKELVEQLEFDTIYHEHFSYFSLTSLVGLFRRHSLTVVDVERLPLHGGSLRVFVCHDGEPSAAVQRLLDEEASIGVNRIEYYETFSARVRSLKGELLRHLTEEKQRGSSIAAYGASAKGSTLLNYCGIGPALIDFVVDRSTFKQGLFTPGSHLPILPPEALLERLPDLVLLLTWNFADEILQQQQVYRDRGGRFLVPVPSPHLV